ncbi:Uncharacterized protein OBRU01_17693, partial [Operophtera brumata]
MAISFDKHKDELVAAWKDVLDEKTDTNWALFGYEGQTNDLKFVYKGDGGLIELIDDLNSGKIQYAFLKVDVPTGSISKYVLINWQGEGAPTVRKGTCANHMKHVASFFTGFHLMLHARTEDDLDEAAIQDKLAKAGSAFNFKTIKEDLPPSGPIGTAYQKEKRKTEDAARKRDDLDTERRANTEKLKSETPVDSNPAGVGAELERRKRSQEAKQLIGASTANARAMFQQNLAQGQIAS